MQGVGFRFFTVGVARGLGLAGTVGNRPEESVGLVVEGGDGLVSEVTDIIRGGPPASRVDRLDIGDEKPSGCEERFEIRYRRQNDERSPWRGQD